MKKLFITLFTILSFFSVTKSFSQASAGENRSEMTNMIKLGGNIGMSVPNDISSMNLGFDLGFQHLVTPHVGIGLSSGYTHFFGKTNNGIMNNDHGVIPMAGMFRYYFEKQGLYLGSDLGYGIVTGNEYVASNSAVKRPDGGLYIRPEIGWHNRRWNIAAQYMRVFTGDNGKIGTQEYSLNSISLGVSYNFMLGK